MLTSGRRCVIESGPSSTIEIRFAEIEKFEQQFPKIFRTIGFDFETNSVAAAGPSQFLLDAAQQIFGFFLVDIEIAVARDAEGVHAVENQARKKIADVMFDQRSEVDVIPRFVFALAARHQNEPRQDARNLDDGMQQFAAALCLARAQTNCDS